MGAGVQVIPNRYFSPVQMYIYIYKCCILERVVCFFSFSGREIFELDNYSPIPVENETEYKLVVSRFPFHDAEIEKVCSAFSDGH